MDKGLRFTLPAEEEVTSLRNFIFYIILKFRTQRVLVHFLDCF